MSIGRSLRLLTILLAGGAGGAKGQPPGPPPVRNAGLTAFSSRKAEVLLADHLPCLGCHTLRGSGGRIGPDLTTVRERRSVAYIAAIIEDPQRVVPGSAMPRPQMDAPTRALLTRYFQNLPGNAEGAPSSALSSPQPDGAPNGEALYTRWCVACHGTDGKGSGPNARFLPVSPTPHADASLMGVRSDDALYDTIASGGRVMNRSPRMPAFGGTLGAAEIRALVAHIRRLCACDGPAWSRDGSRAR